MSIHKWSEIKDQVALKRLINGEGIISPYLTRETGNFVPRTRSLPYNAPAQNKGEEVGAYERRVDVYGQEYEKLEKAHQAEYVKQYYMPPAEMSSANILA